MSSITEAGATVAVAPTVLATFHPFKKLPIELRVKIWGMAEAEPATVTTIITKNNGKTELMFDRKPPALLYACKESRQEWKEDLEGPQKKSHPVYSFVTLQEEITKPTWFSFEIDTFVSRASDLIYEPIHPRIRSLAIDASSELWAADPRGRTPRGNRGYWEIVQRKLPKLDTLILIRPNDQKSPQNSEFKMVRWFFCDWRKHHCNPPCSWPNAVKPILTRRFEKFVEKTRNLEQWVYRDDDGLARIPACRLVCIS